jgi:hypothetical protein
MEVKHDNLAVGETVILCLPELKIVIARPPALAISILNQISIKRLKEV